MKNGETCYLCGAIATTYDHIPPKSLFPKNYQYKGVKVPACKSCNNATSKDDEYLRDSFAMTGWNNEARQVFLEGVRPSYMRPYAMKKPVTKHQRILNSMAKVDVKTPNGILLKQATAMKMKMDRVNSSLEKIVRGLYAYHHKFPIPKDYIFEIYFQPPDILASFIKEAQEKKALEGARFGNTFSYMHTRIREDRFVSIWWLSFYQTHEAIVLVDSPKRLLG